MRRDKYGMATMRDLMNLLEVSADAPVVEALSNASPYTWLRRDWNRSEAVFDAEGTTYRVVIAHKEFLSGDRDLYACEFYAIEADGTKRVDVTGTKNAFAVLGTVIAILREWVEEMKPDVLGMSAEGASRIKLYRALARRLDDIPGYIVRVAGGASRTNFYFTKEGD